MFKKLLVPTICIMFMTTLISGCGKKGMEVDEMNLSNDKQAATQKQTTPDSKTAPAPAKKIKVGFSNASLSNSWRVAMLDLLKAEVAKHGDIEFTVTDAKDDSAQQVKDIENLISQRMDLILVAPATPDGVNKGIEEAYDKKIPVVIFDRPVTTDKYTAYVALNDYGNGIEIVNRMAQKLKEKNASEKGNVLMIQAFLGTGTQVERERGIKDGLKKHPDINIVFSKPADFARDKGKQVTKEAIDKKIQFDGVLSQSGESAVGVLDAVKEANLSGKIIIGIDGYNGALKGVKKGEIDSIALTPVRCGVEALNVGLKILNGEKVEKTMLLPVMLVTADNVNQYVDMNADDGAWTY